MSEIPLPPVQNKADRTNPTYSSILLSESTNNPRTLTVRGFGVLCVQFYISKSQCIRLYDFMPS